MESYPQYINHFLAYLSTIASKAPVTASVGWPMTPPTAAKQPVLNPCAGE